MIATQSFKDMHSNEEIPSETRVPLDCSLYDDDYDVLASFPFHVNIQSDGVHSSTTYAYQETEYQIYMLVIENENVLPLTVFCLKHLKYFNMINSSIFPYFSDNDADFQFPPEIEYLSSSLTTVYIENTKVTQLPENFGKLKNLSSFEMRNTGLINLPDAIGNLPLNFLRLDKNNLVSLPQTISNIGSLNMLILDDNLRLHSLQSLNGNRNMQYIMARNCSIDRLPYNLPNLISATICLIPRNCIQL
ncbi:unnamed protein product [Rotaria sordida]|nr:unnamed protein product [Rotaria sordida]CAF1412162.1 unnamed protein product [Rotaria sordida]